MGRLRSWSVAVAGMLVWPAGVAADDGWERLFNGRDLSGWVNVNTAPKTWRVRDGHLVCSGSPRGFLRTERMYQNYVLELEWRHTEPAGNAGLFVHADALPQQGAPYPESVEVQVRDGDHGSIFGIRGARIRPLTNPLVRGRAPLARPTEQRLRPAGKWNHYRLVSRGGTLSLAVNGRVVTRAADATSVKGHICLQAERYEVHFRNIRIKELPASAPPRRRVADGGRGLRSLFDGKSFEGWDVDEGLKDRWEAEDGVIRLSGNQPAREGEGHLWSAASFENFVLVADWRLAGEPTRQRKKAFTEDGRLRRDQSGKPVRREILHAGDSGIYLRGEKKAQVNIWSQRIGSGGIYGYHTDKELSAEVRRACLPRRNADFPFGLWNRFVITMRGQRVTVELNGRRIVDGAKLPGVAERGPIGLENHGEPVAFRNLFIKRLEDEKAKPR